MKLFPYGVAFALVLLLNPAHVFSIESSSELSGVDQRVVLLEAKVNRIKALQEKIHQKQAEVDSQLDVLKMRIHRS